MLFLAGLSARTATAPVLLRRLLSLPARRDCRRCLLAYASRSCPTAGQDLAVSDELVDDDVDERSAQAHFIYEGMCLGVCAAAISAVGYLALPAPIPPIISTLLCLMLCAAVVLHAGRHRHLMVRIVANAAGCVLRIVCARGCGSRRLLRAGPSPTVDRRVPSPCCGACIAVVGAT